MANTLKQSDAPPLDHKAASLAKRMEIRRYITEDRDTIVKKWKALTEYIHKEDRDREHFYVKKAYNDTRVLPDTIDRFLRTLKKSLATKLRKGGTPYSIVRDMFIYWDATKSGTLSSDDMERCLIDLGVHIDRQQVEEIVTFYSDGRGQGRMTYQKLLKDLLKGEPTLVMRAPTERETDEDRAKRFKMMEDKFIKKPKIVEKFLEAVRDAIMKKLVLEGGTPYSHVRHAFLMFDWNYSNALDEDELMKAVRLNMGLSITEDQAREIIDFYDRKNVGEMDYKVFLEHVCEDMDVFLSYTEETPRTIAKKKKSMEKNPFVIQDFKALPNKTLELFKRKVRHNLFEKISNHGGTILSWMTDAFSRWDPSFTGKIFSWQHLQGACKRFGFVLTEDEAKQLMASYATDESGSIEYRRLMNDCCQGDPHFLTVGDTVGELAKTATSRAPPNVSHAIKKFKCAVDTFSRHSKGEVDPRDVMYGTFLRVDRVATSAQTGRVSEESFRKVLKILKLSMTDKEVSDLMQWFDSNGSKLMDYNEFTRQLYGVDVLTKKLSLPAISLHLAKTNPDQLEKTGVISHGSVEHVKDKNMKVFKSRARKQMEKEMRKKSIVAEKTILINKLSSIEKQKNIILEQQRLRHIHKHDHNNS